MSVSFIVEGTPAPQGSKKAYVRGTRAVLVESSKKVPVWRAQVAAAARAVMGDTEPFTTPVRVEVVFWMARPASVSEKKRPLPTVYPDIDKLSRALLDGMTKIIYRDDALVVDLVASKRYSAVGGASISVIRLAAS